MKNNEKQQKLRPEQTIEVEQGQETSMNPSPKFYREKKQKRLNQKAAIITGADSGIGRAVAVAFAQEGANVTVVYKEDKTEAEKNKIYS